APAGGDVGAQPWIDLITETDAGDAGAVEARVNRAHAGAWRIVEYVEEAFDLLVAHADIAAQIPAAEITFHDRWRRNRLRVLLRIRLRIGGLRIGLRIRRRRRRDRRHIGCNGCRRQRRGRRGNKQKLYTTHWLRPHVLCGQTESRPHFLKPTIWTIASNV